MQRPQQQRGYRGRVRSGCITCRTRKVKCDEVRPVCKNCARLKRRCAYEPRKTQRQSIAVFSYTSTSWNESASTSTSGTGHSPGEASTSQEHPTLSYEQLHAQAIARAIGLDGPAETSPPQTARDRPILSPDHSSVGDVTARLERALRRRRGCHRQITQNSTMPHLRHLYQETLS